MKKSIALLSTLLFISIIIAIISSIYTVYEKYSIEGLFYKNMTQNSIFIQNTSEIMSKIASEINSSEDLDTLFNTYQIKNDKISLKIKITPLFDKINLNEIALKQTQKYIKAFLQNLLESYNVQDPNYFTDLILDSIDKDTEERNAYSEIKLTDPSFKNGKIYSMQHFNKILRFYAQNRNDTSVLKIPWDKYIYFGDLKRYPIDCDRLDKNSASFLGLVFDNFSCEDIKSNKENKKIISSLDIISYDKKKEYFVNINLNYNTESIKFTYDINSKKVITLEYNPVY